MLRRRGTTICCLATLGLMWGCGGDDPTPAGGSFRQQVEQAMKEPDPGQRADKLIRLADKQRRAADTGGAEDTFSLARKACGQVENAARRAELYAFLAHGYARAKKSTQAEQAIREARDAAQKYEPKELYDYREKFDALAAIAQAQSESDDKNGAFMSLNEAEKLLQTIPLEPIPDDSRGIKSSIQVSLALAYQKLGNESDAQRMAAAAVAAAGEIKEPQKRSKAVADVALGQSKLEMADKAAETFSQAETIARSIENDAYLRANALLAIAERRIDAKLHQEAAKLLDEADKLALDVKDDAFRKELQEKVRDVRRRRGG